MEIERKYLIKSLPAHLESFPFHQIEQGYLCTEPVVRIRRQDETYYLTYKSKGLMVREEYNLPLTREAWLHLRPKADGILIAKKRYLIPLPPRYTIELDIFEGEHLSSFSLSTFSLPEADTLIPMLSSWSLLFII